MPARTASSPPMTNAAKQAAIEARLTSVRGGDFIVFHDAYHYFEARFGVEAAGAVSLSDATSPGPARVAEVRKLIEEAGAACVFTEPQFDSALVDRLVEGTAAKVGTLDPHGVDIGLGPDLYPALLSNLAEALATCLEG